MRFIGVDLAWGARAHTGLAVLDQQGQLLSMTDAYSEAEIIEWLGTWTDGACLVAVDAPLIVTNPQGARQCERLVAHYFGGYRLAAHPTNTARPTCAGGDTRGLRIAIALGLDVDPCSAAHRRAIEVYPHAAVIVLFDLPRVLQYKQKSGRDLPHLKAEALRLIHLLEGLHTADVPLRLAEHEGWRHLRETVVHATRKADLKRVEDRIDAVICAYIASYAAARPKAVRVLGNRDEGYILTPVTPVMAERIDADHVSRPWSGGLVG